MQEGTCARADSVEGQVEALVIRVLCCVAHRIRHEVAQRRAAAANDCAAQCERPLPSSGAQDACSDV